MKTALVSLCYLNGVDPLGNNRLDRNKRYIEYYWNIREKLGFNEIILIDNYSNSDILFELETFAEEHRINLTFRRFLTHLPRREGNNNYPYCWRGIYALQNLMSDYEKIIHIDSDGFVLTERLAQYIKDLRSGWTSFWCETWGFPEGSMHILCEDAYPIARKYFETPWEERVGRTMELDLPFTHIERSFKCGRFGETTKEKQTLDHDYYGQACLDIPLKFDLLGTEAAANMSTV